MQRLRVAAERFVRQHEACVRLVGRQRLRNGGERIARVVVAGRRILERVEHTGRVAERARVNACAIVEPFITDAAVVGQQALRRQQRRDAVARRGALARSARLLADADSHQVRGHCNTRAAARSARHAFGVVRIARLAAPRAHRLLTLHQIRFRRGCSARIAGSAVEFVRDGLRVDDRALRAQARDDGGVERRRIHREVDVAVRRRPHVFRVEGILDRRGDAVHRQRREIGVSAVLRVQFGGAFERVGLSAKGLADGRRSCRQRSGRRVRIERALARNRSLAADVERFERVQLTRIRNSHAHAHLRGDARIRHGPLHAAVIERQARVLVDVGQNR